MTQTLIKIKAKKARLLDEHMAKRLHDEEIAKAAREKQEKDDLERAKVQEIYEENVRKYQDLKKKHVSVAQAKKNMIIYLKNMAEYKMEHFRGMTYDKFRPIFEREYNKVLALFKPDKDVEEPKKKRVAEETLLQESFKKLKAVEVLGYESPQETPTDDPKEMTEEDVQNMLEIVLVAEFKVEALHFHRTEGAVGLVRCFKKMENTFEISECAEGKKVKFSTGTFYGRALTWWNFQVATLGHEVANGRPWTEVKQMMTDEFCLTEEV
nr:putative reverse transcriptase domain-containing protein [Tanacetum cinerariifolium]